MNLENIEVKLNKPYPEIINAKEDRNTICVLKNLLSSRVGKLVAVLQYSYQSVVADDINNEISEILEEISIVEMMHMELLMNAIKAFGGLPKYEDCQGNYFNANNIFYSMKLKDMLEINIAGESRAIEEYNNAIKKVNNESLKNLFKRIIEDEELHVKILKQIKNNVEFLSI